MTALAFMYFRLKVIIKLLNELRYLQEYSQFRQKQVKEIKEVERTITQKMLLLALKRQKGLAYCG